MKRLSLIRLDEKWNESKDRSNIIISLTTIPVRIEHIENTIKSILYQKRLPKKILLNIPYKSFRGGEEYIIPAWLQNLKSLDIVRVEEDFGPATKFIPSLESQEKDQPILVLDDDHLYPKNYIQEFEEAELKYPDYLVTACGWQVPEDLVDRPTTLKGNIYQIPPTPLMCTRIKEIRKIDIVQGYAGYLIKPSFFDINKLKDYSQAPEELRYVDDVWISAHSLVQKFIIPMKRFCYNPNSTRKFYKSTSLAKISNKGKLRNEDRHNSIGIRFFKGRWLNA